MFIKVNKQMHFSESTFKSNLLIWIKIQLFLTRRNSLIIIMDKSGFGGIYEHFDY